MSRRKFRVSHLSARIAAVTIILIGLGAGVLPLLPNGAMDTLSLRSMSQNSRTAEVPAPKADIPYYRPAGVELQQLRKENAVVDQAVTDAKAKADTAQQEVTNRTKEAEKKAQERDAKNRKPGEAPPPAPVDCQTLSGNRQTGCSLLGWAGFGTDQMPCLDNLWARESGWRTGAGNPSTGAYGIPQALPGSKMAAYGDDWQTNAVPQIKWGLMYIKGRYGIPCKAWANFQATGWY